MNEGALILVAMVDGPGAPKRFQRKRWPLHVTIVPWFTVPDEPRFGEFLENHLPSERAFDALIGPKALFGAGNDIPVNIIRNKKDFGVLHNYVLEVIADHGGDLLVNTWIGADYKPHVTQYGGQRLSEGDIFTVSSLSLVRLGRGGTCEIIRTIALGGAK